MHPHEELLQMIAQADRYQRRSIGVSEFEREFEGVLQFIESHPELRPKVVDEFKKLLRDVSYGPYTLIEFCMHKLRWPEMLTDAKEVYANCRREVVRNRSYGTPSQHLSHLEKVICSFEDCWEDKDLFGYYLRGSPS